MVNKLDDRTCATCLSILNYNHTRKKHEKVVHKGVKPSKFNCLKCGKAYMNSNALNYHMNNHETPQNFSCEECGKQFVSEMGLHEYPFVFSGPDFNTLHTLLNSVTTIA